MYKRQRTRFQVLFHSPRRGSFRLSLTVLVHYRSVRSISVSYTHLGIDVDVCRGVAAAVFGDDTKVKYTPLTAKERFTALQSGEEMCIRDRFITIPYIDE